MKRRLFGAGAAVIALVASTVPVQAGQARPVGISELSCKNWAMYGRTLDRNFAQPCSKIDRSNVATLVPKWVYKTPKPVTASPAVVDGVVYVGSWDGKMYALDADDGSVKWTFQTPPAAGAAFGPIVSSAAVADIETTGPGWDVPVTTKRMVFFGSGPRFYALDAKTGHEVWDVDLSQGKKDTRIEFESSPVVWQGRVYVGVDPHDQPPSATGGVRGGLLVLDARTGKTLWSFDPEAGYPAHGCDGVWSSPTIDAPDDLVVVGTASCSHDGPWSPYTDAVVALDASSSTAPQVEWSFRPFKPNRKDWDFGATPNLYRDSTGRLVIGAGNKNGTYYALDARTGRPLWHTSVAQPGDVQDDFSIGGFIGSAAVWHGDVFGATAIGGPPYFHAIDGSSGDVLWSGPAAPSYAATAVVNGVVLDGALDSTFKAFDASSGEVLWSEPLLGPISSGAAVAGDSVYVGSGTSSSDACQKGVPVFSDACVAAFQEVLGSTGGVSAFHLAGD